MEEDADADISSTKYVYGIQELYVTTNFMRLHLDVLEQVLQFLTQEFRDDLLVLDAPQLVEKYGTHVLADIYTGAKLSIRYQAEYDGGNVEKAVEESFRLGLDEQFGDFTGHLEPIDTTLLRGISSPQLVFQAIGADLTKIVQSTRTDKSVVYDFSNWWTSLNKDNAVFIKTGGAGSYVPLYDFIQDDNRKQEVRQYVYSYIDKEQLSIV